jgi:hypothetical protein
MQADVTTIGSGRAPGLTVSRDCAVIARRSVSIPIVATPRSSPAPGSTLSAHRVPRTTHQDSQHLQGDPGSRALAGCRAPLAMPRQAALPVS